MNDRVRRGLGDGVALDDHAGDPEVGQGGLAVRREQHVVRLDVSVQDAGLVGCAQGAAEASSDRDDLGHRQWALGGHLVCQRATRAVLHGQPRSVSARRTGVVDRHDVRVRGDPSGRQALGAEASQLTVIEGVRTQHLEGDRSVKTGVVGAVDGGEAALVDPGEVLIALRSVMRLLRRHSLPAVVHHCHITPCIPYAVLAVCRAVCHGLGASGWGSAWPVERFEI